MDAPQPKDKLSTLYETLKKEQYDVPTIDVFKKDMSDVSKRTRLHETLLKDNFDVPSFDKFSIDLGFGKEQPKETKQFDVKMPDAFQAEEPLQKIPSYKDKFFDEKRFVSESTRGPKIQTETRQDIVQQADKRKNDALDNTIKKWAKQNNLDPNSPKAKEQRKLYEKGLTDGGIISAPSFSIGASKDGPIIYRNTGMLDSFANSYDKVKQEIKEAKDIREMSDEDAINVLKEKISKEGEAVPERAYGLGGGFGEFFGGAARMILTQEAAAVAVQSGLTLLAPETGGASLLLAAGLAGSEAISSDMQNQAYLSEIQKRFVQGLNEGKDDKEAMRIARIQAERASDISYAEAYAFGFAGQGVKKIFSKPVSGAGVKESLGKVIMSSAKEIVPELVGATATVVGSSVAKDISAKQLGYKVDSKQMFDNAWDSATETWKFMGSMMLLHGAVNKIKQLPGYAVSQLKSFVNSADKGVPQTILDNLAKNKFLDPIEVEKTKKALEEHNVAADQTAALGITDEAAKGSISGKQEKKIKLQKEIDELQKNNITAGVEERLYQIDKLNKEIDEIYKTGNINQHEFDNQLPTQEDISQPIELSPELPEGYELPKQPTEVKPEIILSGLNEGFKAVSYSGFDVRNSPEVMNHINNQNSFAEVIDYKGKKYAVVGLRLETARPEKTTGRDNYSFAVVEINKTTPKNIIETLENSAKENFKDIYKDFNNKDVVKPITVKNPELKTLETQPTEVTNAPVTETEVKPTEVTLESVRSLSNEQLSNAYDEIPINLLPISEGVSIQDAVFEAYFKAKKSDKYPKLVKAVEDLLSKPTETTPTTETAKVEDTIIIDGVEYTYEEAINKTRYTKPFGSRMEYKGSNKQAKEFVESYNKDTSPYRADGVLKGSYINEQLRKALDELPFRKFANLYRKHFDKNFTRENNLRKNGGQVDKNFTFEDFAGYVIGDSSYDYAGSDAQFKAFAKEAGIEIPKKDIQVETKITEPISEAEKQSNIEQATEEEIAAEAQKQKEEYDKARSTTTNGEPTEGVPGEVSPEPKGKPIEEATAPNEARATFEDAGYESEQSARDAYESERDVATNQTYEEWLLEKYCG